MKKLILAAALLAAGCATHPDQIKAKKVAGATCTDADRQRLAELTKDQAAASRNDALGVFLVGLPLGSMGRQDHADEIARLKGACGTK